MNEPEQNTDELWEQSFAEDGTPLVADADSETLADSTDEAGTEEQADATTAEGQDTPESDDDDFDARVEARLAALLPRYRDEWTRDVMNRTRQSMTDRDNQIKARLAPVVALLQKQQQAGYLTPEDANEQYQQAYRQMHVQADEAERKQAQAELYQQWLAQQTPQSQQETRPAWALSIESRMNHLLEQSGLTDADPELKKVPLTITNPDPNEALTYFELAIATARKEKETRLAQAPRQARKEKPFVDMGVGGSAGRENPLAGKEDIDELWKMAGV